MAATEDRADISIGLAGRDPAKDHALARRKRVEPMISASRGDARPAQLLVEPRENRADAIEPLAVAGAEIPADPVQYEADQDVVVDQDRQGDDVVDPDPAVVLVIQRALAKSRERQRIADPMRPATAASGVKAHQRMLGKESIEDASVVGAQPCVGKADHLAVPGLQMTDRKRRQLAGDEPRQLAYAGLRKSPGVGGLFGDGSKHGQAALQVCLAEHPG
ncbi:MAG: hypothetical protein M3Z16_03000 [Pseudomonadota bacterium]|nr:hypothetical protein [Pseudomonadota bacterium]